MLPWAEMMRSALMIGLSPAGFWALSLREWQWLTESESALSRAGLSGLLDTYPDRKEAEHG